MLYNVKYTHILVYELRIIVQHRFLFTYSQLIMISPINLIHIKLIVLLERESSIFIASNWCHLSELNVWNSRTLFIWKWIGTLLITLKLDDFNPWNNIVIVSIQRYLYQKPIEGSQVKVLFNIFIQRYRLLI